LQDSKTAKKDKEGKGEKQYQTVRHPIKIGTEGTRGKELVEGPRQIEEVIDN